MYKVTRVENHNQDGTVDVHETFEDGTDVKMNQFNYDMESQKMHELEAREMLAKDEKGK